MAAPVSPVTKLWAVARRLRPPCHCEENIAIEEPHNILQKWIEDAQQHAPYCKPRVACLAAVDRGGYPLTCLTSIAQVNANGLTFYTSLNRRQALEISSNPIVSLHFHWPALARNVRVAGVVKRLPQSHALQQFRKYPRHIQLGICCGRANALREKMSTYDQLVEHLCALFGYKRPELHMPKNWGGFLVQPCLFEFGESSGLRGQVDCLRFRRNEELARCIKNRTINANKHGWVYDCTLDS